MYKAIFPNITDRDIEAFIYSKPESEPYELDKDSQKQDGVPEGSITKYYLSDSATYPGTERDYWIFVPKQYDPGKPTGLMIFQEGGLYLFDMMNANIVLDNLIDKKEMPVVIAVFINPGDKGPGMPVYEGTGTVDIVSNTAHRSFPKPYGGFGTITRNDNVFCANGMASEIIFYKKR